MGEVVKLQKPSKKGTRVRKVVRKVAEDREKTAAWRRILEQTTAGLLRQSEQA